MSAIPAKISETGRMTVPASLRSALGLERGGDVVLEVVDGELHVRSVVQSMDRARAIARKIMQGHPNASVEDFLANRRREASREE